MMAMTCYVMSIKSKNSGSTKSKKNMASKEAFKIRLGEEIALNPKDGVESKDIIEPDDEVKEFIDGEGKK
jgi:hypothetical protein